VVCLATLSSPYGFGGPRYGKPASRSPSGARPVGGILPLLIVTPVLRYGPRQWSVPGQARGVLTSSGTDFASIAEREVSSGDVIPFSAQSVSTRIRFPDMEIRW
jgi:hypothetical protein